MSHLEESLAHQLEAIGLPPPAREFQFARHHVGAGAGIRKRLTAAGLKDWRFDLAWPDAMLAVEVEGGAWVKGRHNRGEGFAEDLLKYDAAMRMGWTVYRCAGDLINSGQAVKTIHILLAMRRAA